MRQQPRISSLLPHTASHISAFNFTVHRDFLPYLSDTLRLSFPFPMQSHPPSESITLNCINPLLPNLNAFIPFPSSLSHHRKEPNHKKLRKMKISQLTFTMVLFFVLAFTVNAASVPSKHASSMKMTKQALQMGKNSVHNGGCYSGCGFGAQSCLRNCETEECAAACDQYYQECASGC